MNVIFDFDNTLLPEESTVEVLKIALSHKKGGHETMQYLADIAPRAFAGKSTWQEKLLMLKTAMSVTRQTVDQYVASRVNALNPVLKETLQSLTNKGVKLHVISGGYTEWITPLLSAWEIQCDQITANRFIWLGNRVVAIRPSPLLSSKGKVQVIHHWKSQNKTTGKFIIVGDGSADQDTLRYNASDAFVSAEYFQNNQLPEMDQMRRASTPEEVGQHIDHFLTQLSPAVVY
ncbi:HAD-IB family phosphatase [Vibrio mangrovi]|uniref:phosphoserine phosphatase n=1 Tax=Vibrio mangrovi TaxID=474394 RepID=A0A1Y6IQI8_9VIBR|nr:HAD-IB family phosphatase [Vibrio mangrovi]MDW6003885.1 HAD-IB family phosphatase [Vibrio mangrovi]SMR99321.1 haloacid dehalogenase-like hydrolase [Vibrio mangrovi]